MTDLYAVTWGMGGEGHTVAGLHRDETAAWMRDMRTWGPVTMVYGPGRAVCYAGTGVPVAEGNLTGDYLRRLSEALQGLLAGPPLR